MAHFDEDEDEELLFDDTKYDMSEEDLDEAKILFDTDDESIDADDYLSPEDNSIQLISSEGKQQLHECEHEPAQENQEKIQKRSASEIGNSDSEGTDTKDENDDDQEAFAQKKIRIYRTISDQSPGDPETASSADFIKNDENSSVVLDISSKHDMSEEDDDSEEDERDGRNRFTSERGGKEVSNIVRRQTDSEQRKIPDTLEISEEDRLKLEDFNKKEQERRMMKRNKGRGRGKWRGNSSQDRFNRDRMNKNGPPRMMLNRPLNQRLNFRMLRPPQPNMTQLPPPLLFNPPLFPRGIPPPNMSVPPPPLGAPGILGMPPLPLRLPGFPQLVSAPPSLSTVPAAMVVNAMFSQQVASTIPVISMSNRQADQDSSSVTKTASVLPTEGNPIPTLLSGSQREKTIDSTTSPDNADSNVDREVNFNKAETSSSQLSVKISRASRSRSSSPPPRASRKRTVLAPRRSRSPRSKYRGRSPSSKKRSRRKSRSYSPKRSASRASNQSKSKSRSTAPKPGKILINPHFKGNRNIPASSALNHPLSNTNGTIATTVQTNPVSSSALPVFSVIRPSIINVPPPPLPVQARISQLAPPKMTIPPPSHIPRVTMSHIISPSLNTAIPPPTIISIPPPRLPSNPISIDISKPPPSVPLSTVHPPMMPPISLDNSVVPQASTRPPSLINIRQPPPVILPRMDTPGVGGGKPSTQQPVVHIRPIVENTQPSNIQQRLGNRNFSSNRQNYSIDQQGKSASKSLERVSSRLKPPPSVEKTRTPSSTTNVWKTNSADNAKYQSLLKEQHEKRKQILAMKAKRRKGGGTVNSMADPGVTQEVYTPYKASSCKVKVSNLASVTELETIKELMRSIGQVGNVTFDTQQRVIHANFNAADKAEAFAQKYNRYMLDLSYITVSVER